jgi:NitT/TauT family transport system substrate-binding protein
MKKSPLLRSLVLSLVMLTTLPTFAAVKKEFNVCWTIYAGWMPWGTISNSKIIDKWADKYGIKINIVQLNDYIESINQYTAGQFDGCTMTNMDALTIPAAGGVDSTALILGSYSEGNDGVVMKGEGKTLKDLKGQQIYLPELSVSHYLLVRGLESGSGRKRCHRGEHLRCRYRLCLRHPESAGGCRLEPATVGYQRHAENHRSL